MGKSWTQSAPCDVHGAPCGRARVESKDRLARLSTLATASLKASNEVEEVVVGGESHGLVHSGDRKDLIGRDSSGGLAKAADSARACVRLARRGIERLRLRLGRNVSQADGTSPGVRLEVRRIKVKVTEDAKGEDTVIVKNAASNEDTVMGDESGSNPVCGDEGRGRGLLVSDEGLVVEGDLAEGVGVMALAVEEVEDLDKAHARGMGSEGLG